MTEILSEQIQRYLRWRAEQGMRPLGTSALGEARKDRTRVNRLISPPPAGTRIVRLSADGGRTPLLVVHPTHARRDAFAIYVHGGGWAVGTAEDYAVVAAHLAEHFEMPVVVPDYPLAPENPFPAAPNAIDEVIDLLHHSPEIIGAPPEARFVLLGDSAGGTLAIGAALTAERRGRPAAALLLAYPAVTTEVPDDSAETPATVGLSRAALAWFLDLYLPEPLDRQDARANPISAPLGSLPRTVIVTAEHDILNPSIDRFISALEASGTAVQHRRYARQIHTFFQLVGVTDAAVDAYRYFATELDRILEDGAPAAGGGGW